MEDLGPCDEGRKYKQKGEEKIMDEKRWIIYCNRPYQLEQHRKLFEAIEAAEVGGKRERVRAAEAIKSLEKPFTYDGRFGEAWELMNVRPRAKKNHVSGGDEVDNTIPVLNARGKIEYLPREDKTNGGRISQLLEGPKSKTYRDKPWPAYICYTLSIPKPITDKKKEALEAAGLPLPMRTLPSKVIPTEVFINKLLAIPGMVKPQNHKGKLLGYGIQVSKKPWFEWLEAWPIEWHEDEVYEAWMFEGLE